MAAIRKPSQNTPVQCSSCKGIGSEQGIMGAVVCGCCLGVGYTTPDGEPLDDNDAIRLLKREANYWREKADKALKQLNSRDDLVNQINRLINPPPEVYVTSTHRQVYHGD